MNPEATRKSISSETGKEMHDLVKRLYPICRSITGEGVRQTLNIVKEYIPLKIHEVPTGTRAFDWTVPPEWNIKDAYVASADKRRVVDFRKSNLHVVGYSVPVRTTMSLKELREHLVTLPDHPDWIPYRTSYYKKTWGFCMSQNQLSALKEGEYEVCIDSSLEKGTLTYGELLIKGSTKDEVLISTHICHPSMCNDNLSGIALCTLLARQIAESSPRYSYRFLFVPGTIGSIVWLSRNQKDAMKIKHGLVVACVGDGGIFNYKKSRKGTADIDRIVVQVLKDSGQEYSVREFSPYGYDERQYCSPGFNLPVGSLTRTPHDRFPEYHTSADNTEFVRPEYLAESLHHYMQVVSAIEGNRTYVNQNPRCEPQLGKRGLYRQEGGKVVQPVDELAVLWVLNLSDGDNSLLDIVERSGLPFGTIASAANALKACGLLKEKRPGRRNLYSSAATIASRRN